MAPEIVKNNTSPQMESPLGKHKLRRKPSRPRRKTEIGNPPVRPEPITPRPRYRPPSPIEALGLYTNPFVQGVTEQETQLNFAEIYVEPETSLLNFLEQVTSAFVFADYGMGKSATRLALEHLLRSTPSEAPTLAVRYTPKVQARQTMTLRAHLEAIAHEMAIELVIQTLERYTSAQIEISDQFVAALCRQSATLPHYLRSQIQVAAEHPPSDGAFWRPLRPAVEWISVTPRWRQLVAIMAGSVAEERWLSPNWNAAVEDAYTLGFGRIFVLVDAIDEEDPDPNQLLRFLTPLLAELPQLQQQGVFVKCFLPLNLETQIFLTFRSTFNHLTVPPTRHKIKAISSDDLQQILTSRLRAARQHPHAIAHLDQLAGPDMDESIQAWLAKQAAGSPRRVVYLASELLDFHTWHGFRQDERLHLTLDEWRAFQQQMQRSTAPP